MDDSISLRIQKKYRKKAYEEEYRRRKREAKEANKQQRKTCLSKIQLQKKQLESIKQTQIITPQIPIKKSVK